MTVTTQEELPPPVAYISGNGDGRLVWAERVQSKAKHLFEPLYTAEQLRQCIATLRAENERVAGERDRWREDSMRQAATINRLAAAADDRNKFDEINNRVHQADIVASQSQAAAMAGLLEEACNISKSRSIPPFIIKAWADWLLDVRAALAVWKGNT